MQITWERPKAADHLVIATTIPTSKMTFQQEFQRFQSSHRSEGVNSFYERYPCLSELCSDRGLFVHGLRDGGAFIFALDRSVEIVMSEAELSAEESALELEADPTPVSVH